MDKLTKLSQAIRLGSTFRPQCREAYFEDGKSCAIGAAYEALTGEAEDLIFHPPNYIQRRFVMMRHTVMEVMRMNDAGCTREECAEWLEGQGL